MNNKELARRAKFAYTHPKAAGMYVPKEAKSKALGKKKDWMRDTYLKAHPEKRAGVEARESKAHELRETGRERINKSVRKGEHSFYKREI